MYAKETIEDIAVAKSNSTINGPQVIFQQIYTNANLSITWDNIARAERTRAKAIVWTIDVPGDAVRHRAARFDTTKANFATSELPWDLYDQMKNYTSLAIIPKGIASVENAREAIRRGVKAIYISNHDGRQLDNSTTLHRPSKSPTKSTATRPRSSRRSKCLPTRVLGTELMC
ncbi:hypothetical protein PMIN04_010011 [Paraphaeosphaeria minitans]